MHTHSIYSDGWHTPEELVINALKNGLETIGISDHHKAIFREVPRYKGFDEYISELTSLKERYNEFIEVKSGIEISLNFDEIKDEKRIPYDKLDKIDFALLERVEGIADFPMLQKHYIRFKDIGLIAEKINCKIGLAHTDLLRMSRIYSEGKEIEYGMEYIISIMEKYNIFWELNTSFLEGYFGYILLNWSGEDAIKLFQSLKEHNIEITTGTDTHRIYRDFKLPVLELASRIASGELVPWRDELPTQNF